MLLCIVIFIILFLILARILSVRVERMSTFNFRCQGDIMRNPDIISQQPPNGSQELPDCINDPQYRLNAELPDRLYDPQYRNDAELEPHEVSNGVPIIGIDDDTPLYDTSVNGNNGSQSYGTPYLTPINKANGNGFPYSIPINGTNGNGSQSYGTPYLTPINRVNGNGSQSYGTPYPNEAISQQNMLSRDYKPFNPDTRPRVTERPNDLMAGTDTSYKPPSLPMANPAANVWVNSHNRIRSAVHQSPVAWNNTIANGATQYAERLAQSNNCQLIHSSQNERKLGNIMLGENLAMGSPASAYDEAKMMGLWEDEKQYYRYPDNVNVQKPRGQEVGHYTQIINKNVKEIGCGCATCGGRGGKVCVCRYNPIQIGNQAPY